MRRLVCIVVVLGVLASCASEGTAGGNTTSPTTTPAATTLPDTTSSTTTSAVTTTTSPGPALLPGRERDLIPWDEVGPGWFLVVYTARPAGAVYLLDPLGTTYEVMRYDADGPDLAVLDWSATGTTALIRVERDVSLLDLTTGRSAVLFSAPPSSQPAVPWHDPLARFESGDATALLVSWTDGARERLERIPIDGSERTVILEQEARLDQPVTWVRSREDVGLVVGGSEGLQVLDVAGAPVRGLDTPGDGCLLRAWWDETSVLVSCLVFADGPYFEQLWLVPVSGGAAAPLTAAIDPEDPSACPGGECGYEYAWRRTGDVITQWFAYDFVAGVRSIDSTGRSRALDVGGGPAEASYVAAVDGTRLAVLERCPGCIGGFDFFGWIEDGERTPLIPKLEGASILEVYAFGGPAVWGSREVW